MGAHGAGIRGNFQNVFESRRCTAAVRRIRQEVRMNPQLHPGVTEIRQNITAMCHEERAFNPRLGANITTQRNRPVRRPIDVKRYRQHNTNQSDRDAVILSIPLRRSPRTADRQGQRKLGGYYT